MSKVDTIVGIQTKLEHCLGESLVMEITEWLVGKHWENNASRLASLPELEIGKTKQLTPRVRVQ